MPLIDIADPTWGSPDALILDASLLLELPLGPQTKDSRQIAVQQFLKRVSAAAAAGQMLCLAPVITFEECYFHFIKLQYQQALPTHQARLQASLRRKKVFWGDLYKDSPQLIQQSMVILGQFREAALGFPIIPIEPEDFGNSPPALEPRMFYHIEHVPILPKDALLLAVAERLKVHHIATLDGDFRAASSWLHIYTIA